MNPNKIVGSVLRGIAMKLRSDLEFPGDTVAKDFSVFEELSSAYVLGKRDLLEDEGVLKILQFVKPILAGRAASGEPGCDVAEEMIERIDNIVSDYEAWMKEKKPRR
jgi:hypothetical protein